jgi:hypothetical protein
VLPGTVHECLGAGSGTKTLGVSFKSMAAVLSPIPAMLVSSLPI